MKQKRYNVAVVGATGAVGAEMLRVLQERRFPVKGLRLLASERSAGTRLAFHGSTYRVEQLTKDAFDGIDIALFSAGASRSLEFVPEAVKRGAMELGADGVLMNTAIAGARDPVKMARAMRLAIEAGRLAYEAGRIPKKLYASASSPIEGVVTRPHRPQPDMATHGSAD